MATGLQSQGITIDEILSRHELKREHIDKECSQGIMFTISVKIINWKMVGHCLGIPEEKIVAIQMDNNREEERRIEMIYTWHQREGKRATYLKLMIALHNRCHNQLIDHLCSMVKSDHDQTDTIQ